MILDVHKNTVRTWLESGLQPVDNRRPILIVGRQLAGFLHARRMQTRQRCTPGQFYCLRCRAPKTSVDNRADYRPTTSISGNLRGTCSACGTRMCRRVSFQKLEVVARDLEITMPQGRLRIEDNACPSPNCDLAQERETYANAQSGK